MAILNWRDHPRLRFVDFPPPFLTKGSVYIAEDRGDTAWISDGTTYLQLYPDTNLVPQEYTWAARPAPGSPGRVIRVSDVGPAPGIEMVDSGTRWRPRGGRQVLAQRSNNPVTVQNLSNTVAETIGPFPGGLVRAGMSIEGRVVAHAGALTTTGRVVRVTLAGSQVGYVSTSGNNINTNLKMGFWITALSDVSGVHLSSNTSGSGGLSGVIDGHINTYAQLKPSIDFSAPWAIDILLTSAAETAVNISSATWSGGIATFNTAADHTLAVGDKTVIAGVTPSGWNIPAGAIVLSVPTTTQFTVALATDPGAYTSGGTSSRISNMILQSYVLELVG